MELLKQLSEAHGQSGNEKAVREIIKKHIKPYVDELYTDKFGNLIARKKGKGTSVMLAAHMDEIGAMVKYVDPDGKVFVSPIGGVEPVVLLGERVQVATSTNEQLEGIITTRDIQDGLELTKIPLIDDLYVDIGMDKKTAEKAGVRPGDYINIIRDFVELGDNHLISGKALDDRVGCYMLIELAKKLKTSKAEIYYVFTVQEEIGLHGAKTSIYSIDPDYAIIIDVTESDDAKPKAVGKCIAHGPILVMKDAEMITTKCINDWLLAIAKKKDITLQQDVSDFGTTDALNVSVSKGGIPCTVVGVAVRNIHSTTSIACKHDITDALTILEILLKNPPKICL